jgi:hypothetical protein
MSVVQCQEVSERTGGRDQTRSRVYTRDFQLITSTATDGSATILDYIQTQNNYQGQGLIGAPGLPQGTSWGSAYEEYDQFGNLSYFDPSSVVLDMKARQNDKDNLQNWFVTLFYAGYDDPTQQPADIDCGEIKWQKALTEDVNGVEAVNSAGDPFGSGFLADRDRGTITIVKNMFTWDPIQADPFQDSLNKNLFLASIFAPGFPPGSCKLSSLTAKRIQRLTPTGQNQNTNPTNFYWQRRAVIEIDLVNGWNTKTLDCGYRAIQGNDGVVREIILDGGGRPSTPYPLDGTGHMLPQEDALVYFPPGGLAGYPTMDWTVLNIDGPGGL